MPQVFWTTLRDNHVTIFAQQPYDIRKTTVLYCWCQDQQMLQSPKLSYIVLHILLILAISDEPERVFSGAQHTVSWERSQIDVQTLEHIECLKHWKWSGILNKFHDEE